MATGNSKIDQFNAHVLPQIQQQNREITAQCNLWTQELRAGKAVDVHSDLTTALSIAARGVNSFGHLYPDISTRFNVTCGLELRVATALLDHKPSVIVRIGTPKERLKPFQEPRHYMTLLAMDTTVSDIPKGPSSTDAEMRGLANAFREEWEDERYDYPPEIMQLVYLATFIEMAEQFRRGHGGTLKATHITPIEKVDREAARYHLKVDVGDDCFTYGMYFKLTEQKAVYLQVSVMLGNVRQDGVEYFDHIPYRAMIAERNHAGL